VFESLPGIYRKRAANAPTAAKRPLYSLTDAPPVNWAAGGVDAATEAALVGAWGWPSVASVTGATLAAVVA
jgi:hypothetical protein